MLVKGKVRMLFWFVLVRTFCAREKDLVIKSPSKSSMFVVCDRVEVLPDIVIGHVFDLGKGSFLHFHGLIGLHHLIGVVGIGADYGSSNFHFWLWG